jgi:gas vesicle protein
MHDPDNSLNTLPASMPSSLLNREPPPDSVELLGAMDIVEAFTALRQELKLQVRSGREIQQSISDTMQRLEQRLEQRIEQGIMAAQSSHTTAPSEGRKLAEAIADIDESLQRAVESLTQNIRVLQEKPAWVARFDQLVANASWLARKFSAKPFAEMRAILVQAEQNSSEQSLSTVSQGFELLMARVRRQMQQCEIERMDVLRQPFDAELMNAIDVIDAPTIPSSHVAEQLRPAYSWRGSLLRYAEVRLAK